MQNFGILHEPVGSDYFIFNKNDTTIDKMPSFLVGRAGWDNRLIFYFRKNGIPVIDCTKELLVIHQNHDYFHIKNGSLNGYEGFESDYNLNLVKKLRHCKFTIEDSDYFFDVDIKKRVIDKKKLGEQFLSFHPSINYFQKTIKEIVKFILPKPFYEEIKKYSIKNWRKI